MDAVQVALLVIILVVVAAFYFFFATFIVGAGYQPTPPRVVRRMLEWAAIGPADRVYDLGAGTGALVFAAAVQSRAAVTAVEVEPIRLLILHLRRAFSPAKSRITIRRTNLFRVRLEDASVVLVFLWPAAMSRLRPNFEHDLRPGARVVSYWHPVPGWEPSRFDRDTQVYLYVVPAVGGGPRLGTSVTPGDT